LKVSGNEGAVFDARKAANRLIIASSKPGLMIRELNLTFGDV
jgi:hypothetical protein